MKTVLITGIAGFLGGHVAKLFIDNDWKVIGIDNLTDYELKRAKFDISKSREHNLNYLKSIGAEFRLMDCRNAKSTDFENIDYIIHCAAQPAMTVALEDPYYDADDNILAAVNMLKIAKELDVPIVTCSSIHVYGNNLNSELTELSTRFTANPVTIDESRPVLQGELTPLHVSKYTVELYTQSFAEMYKLKCACFRLTGMYGERQFGGMDHGWVANFAIRTVMERPITVFGTDKQVRDILYAEDAANAFLMWYENGTPNGLFNIGAGETNSVSIHECLKLLNLITNKEQKINLEPKRKGDLWYFVCDFGKAFKTFGWSPKVSPSVGLTRITKWVENNKEILKC